MVETQSRGRMITPAVVFARAATTPMTGITSYLLIEIGLAFQQPIGIVSQVRTVQSIIAVAFALLMGAISVKFKHKTLLIWGLLLIAISAVGCWITPSFPFLLLVFPLAGIGTAMVQPMTNSLVGEYLPREKRSGAIGWMMTGMASIGILGGFIINYLNGMGGWRLAFIGYAFPVALIATVLVYYLIPRSEGETSLTQGSEGLLSGFKRVYSNRSAMSCLMGIAISQTTWRALGLFWASFYRQQFKIDIGTLPLLSIGTTLCYIGGNLFTGKYANLLGRKRLAIISLLLSGVLMVPMFISPSFLVSYAFVLLFAIVSGIRATSTQSHTMEQMPRARGTLMSCMSAAISLGATLGAAIGGYILLAYSFTEFGYVFGAVNILGALVFAFLTSEKY
jgi:predicted MFS family arabinose efflux permease